MKESKIHYAVAGVHKQTALMREILFGGDNEAISNKLANKVYNAMVIPNTMEARVHLLRTHRRNAVSEQIRLRLANAST